MENQTIEISLEEYKMLRDMLEDYQKLQGDYNLLYYCYKQLIGSPEEEKEIKNNPIGFNR